MSEGFIKAVAGVIPESMYVSDETTSGMAECIFKLLSKREQKRFETKRKAEGGEDDVPKAKKVKKDPNAPKKPLSAYILFTMEVRQPMRDANPGLKMKEIMSLMGAKWKKLSAEEKQKYVDQAAADKVRYQDEMKMYLEQ